MRSRDTEVWRPFEEVSTLASWGALIYWLFALRKSGELRYRVSTSHGQPPERRIGIGGAWIPKHLASSSKAVTPQRRYRERPIIRPYLNLAAAVRVPEFNASPEGAYQSNESAASRFMSCRFRDRGQTPDLDGRRKQRGFTVGLTWSHERV